MPLYLDLLMILNFLVDLLLLIGTNRLSGHPNGIKRALLSATVGGIYGGLCMVPGMRFLGGLAWRVVSLLLMGGIAFGFRRGAVRRCVLFTLLSMALGGVAVGLEDGGSLGILACAGAVCTMCVLGFRGTVGDRYVPVQIRFGDEVVRFTALRDTGNGLTDPVSGQRVLVVSSTIARRLTGLTEGELADPVEILGKQDGIRLIPFCAVGERGGLLAAKRFDEVTIGDRKGSCIVAFAPNELGRGQPYEALTGGVV